MEPRQSCTRQIIAEAKDKDFVLANKNDIAAVITHSKNEFVQTEKIKHLPYGITLKCPKKQEQFEFPVTEQYIALCKKHFKNQMHDNSSFYYLHGADDFQSLRAAVISITDLCGKSIVTEIHVGEDARMHDNTDALAALGVLQRIGVSTVVFTSDIPEHLEDTLERVAPYARISIGVRVPTEWLNDNIKLTNVEILLPDENENADMLCNTLKKYKSGRTASRDHDDYILAPDGRDAHFIDAVTDISDEIECDHKLQERLLEIEDEEAAALKLMLTEEDDLYNLEEDLYMLTRPVCLCATTPELLEKALRIYSGLAIYDGTWELTPEVAKYFCKKYGMIWL